MKRGLCATAVLVTAVAALGGCDRTEILLTIDAAYGLSFGLAGSGADIDSLYIQAGPADASAGDGGVFYYQHMINLCSSPGTADCQPERYVGTDYQGALTLPVELLLSPGQAGLEGDVRVRVDAYHTGAPVLFDGDTFSFSRGHRLWLEIPLYRQCFGDTTCQPLDEICNNEGQCVKDPPTTSETFPDLSTPHDAATDGATHPRDFALPCGTQVNAFCGIGGCCVSDGSLECNASGYCTSTGATCGQSGLDCCYSDMDSAGYCSGNDICSNGKCAIRCTLGTCQTGEICSSTGVCVPCGMQAGQPCCAQNNCTNATTVCETASSTCVTCGEAAGQPCCQGGLCPGQFVTCIVSQGLCETCGKVGDPCCSGGTCLNMMEGQMATCGTGGVCQLCADMGPACCPAGMMTQPAASYDPRLDTPWSRSSAPQPAKMQTACSTP